MQSTSVHRGTRALLALALVLTSPFAAAATWTPIGPAPALGGQSENAGDNRVSGAVHVVLPHPSNADVLYIGSVNGGVWKTSNAQAANPNWTQLTDGMTSLSVGAMDIDPTDASANTVLLGIGRFSNFGRVGGPRAGLFRSTNGGGSWTGLAASMAGRNIAGVAARGSVLLAAVDVADAFQCANIGVFRSTDSGASFTRLGDAAGLPGGNSSVLVGDRADPAVLYTAIGFAGACAGDVSRNGVYRSSDSGASWNKISSPEMDLMFDQDSQRSDTVRIAVGPNGRIAVAFARSVLNGVFHSSDGGENWTQMDLPTTTEGGASVGIHPGNQGGVNTSFAIDPTNPDLVYIGGDRQPIGAGDRFPNSLGARDFSGRLFRGDASAPTGSQWTSLTHSGTADNSSPHADSRALVVDAAGRLLEGDDGGVYVRSSPRTTTGTWRALNGNLQITEQHSGALDRRSLVALSGNQDNGSMRQISLGQWRVVSGGDGGDVAVDTIALAAEQQSISYLSAQNLRSFSRNVYSAANGFVERTFPSLVPTSGDAPQGQFVTPIAAHQTEGGRLLIGASNGLYESFDGGDTVTPINGLRASSIRAANTLAYGAANNPEIIYAAGCADPANCSPQVFVRTTANGALNARLTAATGASFVAVAVDPRDANTALVVESGGAAATKIHLTRDAGASWVDLGAGLPTAIGRVASLEILPGTPVSGVAVGGDRGVYVTTDADPTWRPLGESLPAAPVYDLDYDAARDTLLAATLGRGAFTLTGVLGSTGGTGGLLCDGFEDTRRTCTAAAR